VSDTHFGCCDIEQSHVALIRSLNALEGRAYPTDVHWPSSTVPPLRGLLVAGDLTEWGKPEEWTRFLHFYGKPGSAGALRFPTFEVIGNHDRASGTHVESGVAARHGGKRFYSYDWDRVHFLALGEAPDDEGLAFVAEDLQTRPKDVPLVLYFHLPLDGPAAAGWWFADGDYPDRLEALLRGRNVLALFHGHHHSSGHYQWRGYDVFRPGAVKGAPHEFSVVHITDTQFTLATYVYGGPERWGSTYSKPIVTERRHE
jgi:3',5'-cyclic AMP phosphodiesterase CpdA